MRAQIAIHDGRREIWPPILGRHSNHGDHQAKIDREIPVVVPEPTA